MTIKKTMTERKSIMIDQKYLNGLGITDEAAVKAITETYAADIQAEQDAAAAAKTQLEEANKIIQSYKDMDVESIQKSADEWKQKCEQLVADRKAKEHSDKIDKYVQAQGMRNNVYAEHLKRQILERKLQFDDKGVLTGGDAVVKALRESCPDAFLANPSGYGAAAPTSGHVPTALNGVERAFYAKNPDLIPKN